MEENTIRRPPGAGRRAVKDPEIWMPPLPNGPGRDRGEPVLENQVKPAPFLIRVLDTRRMAPAGLSPGGPVLCPAEYRGGNRFLRRCLPCWS